jgi:hypothetical protein
MRIHRSEEYEFTFSDGDVQWEFRFDIVLAGNSQANAGISQYLQGRLYIPNTIPLQSNLTLDTTTDNKTIAWGNQVASPMSGDFIHQGEGHRGHDLLLLQDI